ncbi:MAG: hypothetical protein NTZ05_07490 [Chloroflexi bacterium]|nr:hypothetical protein [Chloroflexota bacterium]
MPAFGQTGNACVLKPAEPAVNGVAVAGAQQAVGGDLAGKHAVGHPEDGGTTFPDIGARIVIPQLPEDTALLLAYSRVVVVRHLGVQIGG